MTEERAGLPIIAFNDVAALERWLEAQPANSPGLWIKLANGTSCPRGTGVRTNGMFVKQHLIDEISALLGGRN